MGSNGKLFMAVSSMIVISVFIGFEDGYVMMVHIGGKALGMTLV